MIDVVAIDGPVGAGKSSVARRLAERLGRRHLDTGAMYRAVALAALESGTLRSAPDGVDGPACGEIARSMRLAFEPSPQGQRVLLNGRDVTEAIRSPAVNEAVSTIADLAEVREALGRRQREIGSAAPSVAEGRDMGSVIFPDARWKFYIDADPRERARRRAEELRSMGRSVTDEEVLASIAERDARDRRRPTGALRVSEGAIVVDTTGMALERVVAVLEALVRADAATDP